jgi:hypothetical protein
MGSGGKTGRVCLPLLGLWGYSTGSPRAAFRWGYLQPPPDHESHYHPDEEALTCLVSADKKFCCCWS